MFELDMWIFGSAAVEQLSNRRYGKVSRWTKNFVWQLEKGGKGALQGLARA